MRLAAEGAIIGIADIDGESAQNVATSIREAGGQAEAYEADVGRRQAFFDVAQAFVATAGPLRAVINNASVLVYEPIEQVTEDTLDRMLSAKPAPLESVIDTAVTIFRKSLIG